MAPDNGADVTVARQYACTVCRVLYRSDFSRCPRDGGEVVPIDPGDDPLLGATLAGRYVIEELIGEGGMGRVYRARHHELPRRFAIKILFGELAALSDMRARFRMEAEAAARLAHPNVVPVVDVGESEDGLLYLAMEYVAGRNLGAIIDETGPLEPKRAAALARRLCRGLQHAHDHGMVHRDFKPDNVIVLEEDGIEVPRIADFGLAVLTEDHAAGSRLTRKGETMGTPPYMSPEQLTGRPVDARSDLFSLGVVLYEMLTGKTPFEGNVLDMVRQISTEPPPPMSVRVPGISVPAELERIAIKLLANRPEDRYSSANEVIADLEEEPRRQSRTRRTSASPALPDDLPIDPDPVPIAAVAGASGPVALPARSAMSDTGELLALVQRRRRPIVMIGLVGAGLAIAGVVVSIALRGGGEPAGDKKEDTALAAADQPAPPPAAPAVTPPPPAVADAAPLEPVAAVPDAAVAPPPPEPEPVVPDKAKEKDKAKVARSRPPVKARPAAPTQSADELYREGTALYLKGQLAEAKKKYESALSANSRYPAAHRGLGFVYQRLGDRSRALKHLKRYLDLQPKARDAGEVKKRIDALGG